MFQFPRCPLRDRSQSARPCAGRVAPFGDPRIAGCQRLPGAFRRVAASFLGRQRQGIHHAPIMRIPASISIRGLSWPRQQTGARQRDGPVCRSSAPLPRLRGAPMGGLCVSMFYVLCCFAVRAGDQTRASQPHQNRCGTGLGSRDAHQGHRRLPRPQNPSGSAWRFVKVPTTHQSSIRRPSGRREVVKPRPKPSADLGRGLPTRWRSPGPRLACWHNDGRQAPGVEPRGFEPRTSAVQGRRSPG